MSTEDYLVTWLTTFVDATEAPPVDATGNTVVGLFYFTLSLAVLIPYVAVLKVILTDTELQFKSSYRIMLQLGLADILQLVCHVVSGVMTIFQAPSSTSWFPLVCGTGILIGWCVCIWFTMVLALNRLVQICVPQYWDCFFGDTSTLVWIVLGWLWGGVFLVECLTPYMEFTYYADAYTWGYGSDKLNGLAQQFEFYTILGELIISGTAYFIICSYVFYTRSQNTSGNIEVGLKMEIRLMIQAFILFFYTMSALFFWHNYDLVFEDSKWIFMATNIIWIVNNGINPFVYLLFNSTLKKKVFKTLKPENTSSVAPVRPVV